MLRVSVLWYITVGKGNARDIVLVYMFTSFPTHDTEQRMDFNNGMGESSVIMGNISVKIVKWESQKQLINQGKAWQCTCIPKKHMCVCVCVWEREREI